MAWSTLQQETQILQQVDANTSATVTTIGASAGGRPVRLVTIGNGRADVLFIGAQHGDEPAGRQALLDFLASYANGNETVSGLTVCVVPTVNPDGIDNGFVRRNDANADLNRDWWRHTEPETRCVAEVIRDYTPKVAVDLHESRNNITPGVDVELRAPNRAEAHAATLDMSRRLRDQCVDAIQSEGYSAGVYLGDSAGVTNADAVFIIRHMVSMLVESNFNPGFDPADRTHIHRVCVQRVLQWAATNRSVLDGLRQQAEDWATLQGTVRRAVRLPGGRTLDPPPAGYTLTSSSELASRWHRSVFWIDEDSAVPMDRPWWNYLPILFDPTGTWTDFAGVRYYHDDDQHDEEPDDQPDEDDVEREDIAVAEADRRLTWLAVDLLNGRIIEEIPQVSGSIGRTLGTHTSSTLSVPIPTFRTDEQSGLQAALRATTPAEIMIVAVINNIPAWGGQIMSRDTGLHDQIDVSCVTTEGYFDRRFVGDHTFNNLDQNTIARRLLENAGSIRGVGDGIAVEIDRRPSATRRTLEYQRSERATVLRALNDLSDLDNGPEWTVDLDWANDQHTAITRVVRIADRIGRTSAATVFDTQGAASGEWTLTEDASEQRFATYVEAYGQGEGDEQPSSTPQTAAALLQAGVPIFEHHRQADTTNQFQLNSVARATLARMRQVAQIWTVSTRWDQYPRFGIDWMLGDQVAFTFTGPRFPNGVMAQGRIIGWELDVASEMVELTLYDPTGGDAGG